MAGNPGTIKNQFDGSKAVGRPKGVPNKATTRAREAIALLIENNVDKMEEWLMEVHEKDGARAALRVMTDLMEYHLPRLARTEVTGLDGGAVRVVAAREDLEL